MFRNPRENATRTGIDVIRPSVGRPPTPPSSFQDGRPSIASTSMNPSSTRKTKMSQTKLPFTPSTASKAKGRPNQSILNFFKKVEPSSLQTLFIDEQSPRKQNSQRLEDTEREEGLYDDLEWEDQLRFNEINSPAKKQKLSYPDLPAVLEKKVESDHRQEGCTPPPPDIDDRGLFANLKEQCQVRSVGPFVDESDSEDEALASPATIRPTLNGNSTQVDQTSDTPIELVNQDKGGTYPNALILKREATSYGYEDGFAEFEGIEDFEDEYPEGEEFLERQWMREQRRLEMIEAGLEGEIDDNFDDFVFDPPDLSSKSTKPTLSGAQEYNEPTATCPVCDCSLDGLSDEEASVHVNRCLDGNPTSLSENQPFDEQNDESHTPITRFKRLARPAKPGQENPFQLGIESRTSSAFSKLMSGHAENTAWATAAATEYAARGKPSYQRTCPFYKIVPGFFICVDAFRYGAVQGCNAYFLSHFHSDHYIGLTSNWIHGPIYCSRPTANLVKQQLKVDPSLVVELEFEKKTEVPGTQGVFVTMIPANHCPGSSLYLFEKTIGVGVNPKVQRVLHCGDFRACPAHIEHPLLRPETMDVVSGETRQQRIDVCYLDTTYLNPRYAFPSQEDVIQACADMCVSLNKSKVDESDGWEKMLKDRAGGSMAKFVVKQVEQPTTENESVEPSEGSPKNDSPRGRLLVVVGTYSIGKERICLGIARALNSKIYAPPNKQRICACLEDPELNARLTTDPRAAQVHMTPLFEIRSETLADYLTEFHDSFSRAVGFRPSGWNYRPPGSRFVDSPAVNTVLYSDNWKSNFGMRDLVPQRGSTNRAKCFGVPYSEHSSFRELTMFCCALHIDKIIPTVNVGNAKSREKMKMWCERWATERKKSGLFKVALETNAREAAKLPLPKDKETLKNQWYPGKGTWELRTTL